MDTVIITGASKSIGRYLFEHYRAQGHQVFGTYHSTSPQGDTRLSQVDVSHTLQVEQWIASITGQLKNVVLINCAGISYSAFAHKADIEKWKRVVNVNIIGTFNVIHALLPLMREQQYGRIINFASVVAKLPTPGVSAYAASKAALWGLAKSLAAENAAKGITVNNINLGYANIGMGINDVPEEYTNLIKSKIPSGRFCAPEEILATVDYLIRTEYVNGTSIDINGGLI